jgi:hypothetical protein
MLLIHADRDEVGPIIARLNHLFGQETAVDPAQTAPGNQIRVCSLNAARAWKAPSSS